MIGDWLIREGTGVFSWWFFVTCGGLLVYPLISRLLFFLPSRGYAIARIAGLMLIGYVCWLLNSLGFLKNTNGSVILVGVGIAAIGLVARRSWSDRYDLWQWLREHGSLVLTTEALFAVLFVGWCVVRALNPNLGGTEHPMDMAFLSASRRSLSFPPNDPWMAGYAISYYHFGYLLMAMLANLSGVSNGVAFNLAISTIFALAGLGAFSIGYDLVAARLRSQNHESMSGQPLAVGLLACTLFLLMGNLGTAAVEIPYQTRTISPDYLGWLDLKYRPADLSECLPSGSADPTTWGCGWWWWPYSRTVSDYDLAGHNLGDIITEFPQFSFILSDLHPHVMALPFAMLSIALALNLVLSARSLRFWELCLYIVFVGGMVFLNSWDAIYLVFLLGAEALRRLIISRRFTREDWIGLVRMVILLVCLNGLFYLPFFVSFRSQAGGFAPNLVWPTQFQQFFLMFGPFLVILILFLIVETIRARSRFNWRLALVVLVGVALLALVYLVFESALSASTLDPSASNPLTVIGQVLNRRVEGIVTEGVLLLLIVLIVGRLFARDSGDDAGKSPVYSSATGFVLLLIAAGAVLTLSPDFVYLRDGFGTRMNTVFKLYYQGWLLWSLASAYAVWSVLAEHVPFPGQAVLRPIFALLVVVLVGAALLFPADAVTTRAFKDGQHLNGAATPLTLDGGLSIANGLDDYTTIQCLAQVATSQSDVVAEATHAGLAYDSRYGRVSALTGIPTLLGWDNHEGQWRGDTFSAANVYIDETGAQHTRAEAVGRLYTSAAWAEAMPVIRSFGITYIYVGPTERQDYTGSGGLKKFEGLRPVCTGDDGSAVYSVAAVPAS